MGVEMSRQDNYNGLRASSPSESGGLLEATSMDTLVR